MQKALLLAFSFIILNDSNVHSEDYFGSAKMAF